MMERSIALSVRMLCFGIGWRRCSLTLMYWAASRAYEDGVRQQILTIGTTTATSLDGQLVETLAKDNDDSVRPRLANRLTGIWQVPAGAEIEMSLQLVEKTGNSLASVLRLTSTDMQVVKETMASNAEIESAFEERPKSSGLKREVPSRTPFDKSRQMFLEAFGKSVPANISAAGPIKNGSEIVAVLAMQGLVRPENFAWYSLLG